MGDSHPKVFGVLTGNRRHQRLKAFIPGERLHLAPTRDGQAEAPGVVRDAPDGQRAEHLGQGTRVGAVGLGRLQSPARRSRGPELRLLDRLF